MTCTDNIFTTALNTSEGVHVGGETINNIAYADDTAVLADNKKTSNL